jgi:hypothetical protein
MRRNSTRPACSHFSIPTRKNDLFTVSLSGLLKVDPGNIRHYEEIPFLPVSFFRDHIILDGEEDHSEKIFSSSGTTGSIPSQHYVRDIKLYEESFIRSFRMFYGDPGSYLFLALLPGYLERQGSSLVYMMDFLVRESKQNGSGFYLHDLKALKEKLEANVFSLRSDNSVWRFLCVA